VLRRLGGPLAAELALLAGVDGGVARRVVAEPQPERRRPTDAEPAEGDERPAPAQPADEIRRVPLIESGWLASLVLAGATAGNLLGGVLDDLLRRGGARHGRRWLGATAFSSAAALLVLGLLFESPRAMAAFAALSCLATACMLSSWWSAAREVSGRHLGALFGLLNGVGTLGAMGSQFFFGAFADWRGKQGYSGRAQWDPAFAVYVVVLLAAAVCWASYVSRPVEDGGGRREPRMDTDEHG
jgi:MFS family permease